MSQFFGVFLIAVGIIAIAFGGRTVQSNGGIVSKIFRMPRLHAAVVKWAFGLLCIWFGLFLFFTATQA